MDNIQNDELCRLAGINEKGMQLETWATLALGPDAVQCKEKWDKMKTKTGGPPLAGLRSTFTECPVGCLAPPDNEHWVRENFEYLPQTYNHEIACTRVEEGDQCDKVEMCEGILRKDEEGKPQWLVGNKRRSFVVGLKHKREN